MADTAVRPGAGVRLEVLEAGQGGRPLLLTHGFTGAKEDFGDWVDAFAAEGWWVAAPDLRGHGASDQPDDEDAYSLAVFADDLLALADDLGWERFALLGHSMGGMIAQTLVLSAPQRVDRLLLMDTNHGPLEAVDRDTVELAVGVLREQGLPALVELIAQLPKPGPTPSEARVRAERPGYAEFADGKVHRCSAAMYAAMAFEIQGRRDLLDDLARLDLPVRVVVGAEDAGFVPACERLAAAIPGADLVVIPDASHCPQFENPEAWWQAVGPWLSGG